MGWRLAASARRGRDARCRPPVRIVSTVDSGRGNPAPHSRDQSRNALWLPELKVASTMSVNNKRVFYVKYLAHEIYADILRARPDVRLDRLENESPDEVSAPILSAAHAYQIGAARDELAKHFHVDQDALRREPNVNRNALVGTEAHGKTIGIVGLGNVGRRIAALCKGLLGMKVLAYDPYLTASEMTARGGEKVELDELLSRSDYVSVSCPLTRESRGMIGAREFALMRPHAYFITTARGFIHDEAALLEALRSKLIAGAGLDVWAKEPPPPDHPLLQFDNVLASPHTAGVTREARVNMGRIAAEQILDALDGMRPPRIINPEVWPRYIG